MTNIPTWSGMVENLELPPAPEYSAELAKIGTMIELDEEPPGLLTVHAQGQGRQLPQGSRNLGWGRDSLYGSR